MTEQLQQLVNGLSLGAVYALIALGYTMVYGVLRFINFAHSDVFMVGAFVGMLAVKWFSLSTGTMFGGTVAIMTAMALCALLGMTIEKLAYRPLRGRSTLSVLITAIGVSLLLQNGAQNRHVFGPNPRAYPPLFPEAQIQWAGVTFSSTQIVVLVVTLILLAVLHIVVHHTRVGTAMRAVSFNATAASLMGINNDRIITFTFAIGSALAGAGGVLYALNYPSIETGMGTMPGLKAFVAAVLGGIGNLPGAALGGVVLGVIETFVKASRWSTYTDAIAFAVLIVILLLRPSGLLGKARVEKV